MTAEVDSDTTTLDVAREYLEKALNSDRDTSTAQANATIAIGLALVDIAESLDCLLERKDTQHEVA